MKGEYIQTVLDILVQQVQTLQLVPAAVAVGSLLLEMDSLPEIKGGVFNCSRHHQILLDIRPLRLLDRHKVELGIVNVQVGVQLHARVDVLEHSGIVHSHCYQHS